MSPSEINVEKVTLMLKRGSEVKEVQEITKSVYYAQSIYVFIKSKNSLKIPANNLQLFIIIRIVLYYCCNTLKRALL